ncbi:unnamed protein product, partial [Symbiodinium pilosum]
DEGNESHEGDEESRCRGSPGNEEHEGHEGDEGHESDEGDEGHEGNEGDEGNESHEGDEEGRCRGSPSNEEHEGDEGDEGHESDEGAESSVAAAVAKTPTTHRNGQPGRRVDFFMVNNMARPLDANVFVVQILPFVNHFAVSLRLSTSTDMQYTRVQPAARYLKAPATREQTQVTDRQWAEMFRAYKKEWGVVASNAAVDAMWRVLTHVAETSVRSAGFKEKVCDRRGAFRRLKNGKSVHQKLAAETITLPAVPTPAPS